MMGQRPRHFSVQCLSVLAYAAGFTLWHYRAAADVADVSEPGFFAAAGDLLAAGDVVIASARDGAVVLSIHDRPGGPSSDAVPLFPAQIARAAGRRKESSGDEL